ncbi:glycosyltransferase family 39 protein [Candidatus Microgenomates bacterium]|nr:glycosyltransferase family 39 protein [Candidatus Microgenomates bacterium]
MIKKIFSLPFWFFVITVISISLSVFSLYNQSIRLDESQSIWVSGKSVKEILILQSQDVNPFLYNLVLHFWIQIFGTNIIITRSLSLVFFLFTLIAIYVLAKESSNKSTAFLNVVLFALSPFVLWYSNETRTYTLFTLVTALNSIYFLRLVRSQGIGNKLPYVLTNIVGLFTHYFFVLVLFNQIVFALIKLKTKPFLLKYLIPLLIITFGLFSPWAYFVITNGLAAGTQPLIPQPNLYNVFQVVASFLFGFQSSAFQGVIISLWPLTIIFVFLVFTNKPRNGHASEIEYFIISSFLPILVAFIVSYIKSVFLARYLIFTLPSLFFLLAWSIESFEQNLSKTISIGLLVLMAGMLLNQNYSSMTPVKEDYKEVVDYLNTAATPSDIIAVSAPFTIYPIEYSYNGHAKIVTIPDWDQYAAGPTPIFIQSNIINQIVTYKDIYKRLFLVLSYDQGYATRIQNYLDQHFLLLGEKSYSYGINLRVYKLRYP